MIINTATKEVLAQTCHFCVSAFSKTWGNMFARKAKSLVFVFNKEKKVSLHMFFVFFPLDVLFLDNKKKVVEMKQLKPFSVYSAANRATFIVELPAGKAAHTKIGDVLSF